MIRYILILLIVITSFSSELTFAMDKPPVKAKSSKNSDKKTTKKSAKKPGKKASKVTPEKVLKKKMRAKKNPCLDKKDFESKHDSFRKSHDLYKKGDNPNNFGRSSGRKMNPNYKNTNATN